MGEDPTQRAEAQLLGRILLDEERRAAGETGGPRLLDQVRTWGITSSGLFGRAYHRHVWRRIQDIAGEGEDATRQSLDARLREDAALPTEREPGDRESVHPEATHVSHLIELTDAAEQAPAADRSAAMVVDAAMHRSTHDLSVALSQAAHGEPGALADALDRGKETLSRMREAWERLPEQARRDVEATRPRPEPTIAEAQADLAEARSMVAEIRQDPGFAERAASDPAWGVLDKVADALDVLANAAVDAPRNPDPASVGRTFRHPGRDGMWVEHYRSPEAGDDAPSRGGGMISRDDDQVAFAGRDAEQAAEADERAAERRTRESRLLGSVIAAPDQLAELGLGPGDFSDPDTRQVYEVIAELHDSGATVDRTLVDWALRSRGIEAADAIAAPVAQHEATEGGLAAAVARDAHTDRVREAVTGLRELGIDPATSPGDLITRAEAALAELGQDPPEIGRTLHERQEPEAEEAAAEKPPTEREEPTAEPAIAP